MICIPIILRDTIREGRKVTFTDVIREHSVRFDDRLPAEPCTEELLATEDDELVITEDGLNYINIYKY